MSDTKATMRLLLFCALYAASIHVIFSLTDPSDASVLQTLKASWKNTPPSWDNSSDPCGFPWEGVECTGARVTALKLSSMGLIGEINSYIGGLTELNGLVLSFNRGLQGPLPPQLGDLKKLDMLILAGCSFSSSIPEELGNLEQLSFLALNTNKLTGSIPASLGNLSKLYWLDLAENQLTGTIPVSNGTSPGLDQLANAKHFHFNKNQLSGSIPAKLFSAKMILIHVLFDGNKLSGTIPSTIGLVQTLEALRLDSNDLTGTVPASISNLMNVNELNLAFNKLTGPLPDLTGMNSLNYVDLSNNTFDPSEAPLWFSTLPSLTTLVMEFGSLQGPVPEKLFSLSDLQEVKLKYNKLNGTLNMGDSISLQLELVDLQNNQISQITVEEEYKDALMLKGNPICSGGLSNSTWCK
ncbi:leucine-rich repeat receptor protein kinase HPCA1-like [Argentina anserina]|uniref:leucine-rich repeat receptor protein kinase HPCA1-like n=1 Tax=Argentina anserina TaxID=57926 RepID=UPI0021764199|nr:leucine-rich repeat receptor protein kinase HPCA1-like [Potentilla anserina]